MWNLRKYDFFDYMKSPHHFSSCFILKFLIIQSFLYFALLFLFPCVSCIWILSVMALLWSWAFYYFLFLLTLIPLLVVLWYYIYLNIWFIFCFVRNPVCCPNICYEPLLEKAGVIPNASFCCWLILLPSFLWWIILLRTSV